MMNFRQPVLTRRRCIGITAALSAASLLPPGAQAAARPDLTYWQGVALGADAQLQILHPDKQLAARLLERALAEVQRLEAVFSLYRGDSTLVRLNREGVLYEAPADLLRLLAISREFSELTNGAFDPTVQPLWRLYADALSRGKGLPGSRALHAALQKVGYRAVRVNGRDVHLDRPGMQLTLNGIAQGYITDCVTELLRDAGLNQVLVDMGEVRALAPTDAQPWRVGLAGADDARTVRQTLQLRAGAVSTSSGAGAPLDAASGLNHIFDPRTGHSPQRWKSISVRADSATVADALSTAFSLLGSGAIRRIAAAQDASVWAVAMNGSEMMQLA